MLDAIFKLIFLVVLLISLMHWNIGDMHQCLNEKKLYLLVSKLANTAVLARFKLE